MDVLHIYYQHNNVITNEQWAAVECR